METNLSLYHLKLKLASYGAISPLAWARISDSLKKTEIKVNESFNRKIGSIAYVVEGLLKEYDIKSRKKPCIVNFISDGNFLVTTKFNQSKYLKAIKDTTLVYLDFEDQFSLLLKHKELKTIYDEIVANYEEAATFRFSLLEERLAAIRIQQFIVRYRKILSYLKKKDMANYCHIPYDNFVRQYSYLL